MAVFIEDSQYFPWLPWLEMVLTHEFYGHGIGSHSNHSEIKERYRDYVMAPNPWSKIELLTTRERLRATFGRDRDLMDWEIGYATELKNWIGHQLGSQDNSVPWRLEPHGYPIATSSATSLLIARGHFPSERWQEIRRNAFGWRTPNNATTCPTTWRDAWVTPDVILPPEVMDECLENAFEELGVYDVSADEYWRSLKGQDQLVRNYSMENDREALAEHLAIGVLGLADQYQCVRVCRFLESVTDIVLNKLPGSRCHCGAYIYNHGDEFCCFHEGLDESSACYVCKKPIDNPFKSLVGDFIGICNDELCQEAANNIATYQRALAGGTENAPRHYTSLEEVQACELEIGDRVIVLDDFDKARLFIPGEKPPRTNRLLYIMMSKLVNAVHVANDVTTATLLGYGKVQLNSHSTVLRSQLPDFKLLSVVRETNEDEDY